MDLLSLPNEMLTSVLKFAKFGRLTKLRKMNNRIDILARRNNFHQRRIPVDKFEYKEEGRICVMKLYLDEEEDRDLSVESPIIFPAIQNLATTADYYFRFITIEREFVIGIGGSLRAEDMIMLNRQRKNLQKVTKLRFYFFEMEIHDVETVDKFYKETFPKARTLIINRCKDSFTFFCNPAFRERNWKKLQLNLNGNTDPALMTNKFLHNNVIKCKEVKIEAQRTSFNFDGIIQLVTNCIAIDGRFNRKFDLGLVNVNIGPLHNPRNIITHYFDSIDGVHIKFEKKTDSLQECKVSFGDTVNAPYLKFSFATAMDIDENLD